jgi:hypothetical protein
LVREERPPAEWPKLAAPLRAADEEAGRIEWPGPGPAGQPDEGLDDRGSPAPSAEIEGLPEPAPFARAGATPADERLPDQRPPDEPPTGERLADAALAMPDDAAPLPAPGEPRPTVHEGVWEIYPLDTTFPSPSPVEDLLAPLAEAHQSGNADSTLPVPEASLFAPSREEPIELHVVAEPAEPTPSAGGEDEEDVEPTEPAGPAAAEPLPEGPPADGVDYVSFAAEELGAGRPRRAVRRELIGRGLHPDDAKEVVGVMGKECDRQRKAGVSLVTVAAGGALAVVGLVAFLVCRIHHPPYRGPGLVAVGFAVAGLALFGLGLWRLSIKPARVNPAELITVWEEPQ